jgi:hypothetical protein
MQLLPLLLLVIAIDANAGKIKGETLPQEVELPYHHPRSKIGQDPITYNETNMCLHLEDQAWNGPLSHRRNLSGSIGTCDRKTGVCAVYWLDTGLCDILDTATVATRRQPRPRLTRNQRIQNLQDALNHCHSGVPKFGPQQPCENIEARLEEEMMK